MTIIWRKVGIGKPKRFSWHPADRSAGGKRWSHRAGCLNTVEWAHRPFVERLHKLSNGDAEVWVSRQCRKMTIARRKVGIDSPTMRH